MARLLKFYHRWRDFFNGGGFFTLLTLIGTMAWWGFGFIRDTQAYGTEIHMQHQQLGVLYLKGDRTEKNVELIMKKLGITPIPPDGREAEAIRKLEDTIQDGQ